MKMMTLPPLLIRSFLKVEKITDYIVGDVIMVVKAVIHGLICFLFSPFPGQAIKIDYQT